MRVPGSHRQPASQSASREHTLRIVLTIFTFIIGLDQHLRRVAATMFVRVSLMCVCARARLRLVSNDLLASRFSFRHFVRLHIFVWLFHVSRFASCFRADSRPNGETNKYGHK